MLLNLVQKRHSPYLAEQSVRHQTGSNQSDQEWQHTWFLSLMDDGTSYLLHDNGTVCRYYDDGRPETEDMKLVDPGVGMVQISAAAGDLYLLKSNGAVWRISNPRSPDPD